MDGSCYLLVGVVDIAGEGWMLSSFLELGLIMCRVTPVGMY
jgi:hypothetical protein